MHRRPRNYCSSSMAPETTKGIMKLTGNVVGTSIILGICLGHGGFGAVYCGFDTAKGEACAVKAIIRSSRKQLAVKLEREQRVHSLLSSDPSVVSLRAVHEDATYRYFVMDLCLGGNLRSSRLLNEEHPLDPRVFRKKRDLLLQILDVVHRCHSKFIFHRDIKPENILLDENEERIYLADFGLASENAGSEDTKEGTTEYMSPECFGEFSPRVPFLNAPTDVWALGVLLHRMMFNALPWTEASIDCPEFRDFLCDRSGYFLRCWDISKEAHQLLISVFEIIPEKRITIPEFCTRLASIQHFFVPLKQAKELRLVVLNDIDLAWTMSQRAQTVQNYIRFQRGRAYVPLVLPTRPPIETILSSSTMTTIRLVPPPNLPSTDSIATPPLSPNPLDESSSSSSPDSIPLTPQTRSRTKPEDVGVVHDPDLVECMNALDLELEERNPRGRPSVIHIKEATAIREQAKVIVGRTKKEGEVKTCGKRLRIFSGFARALKVHHRVARD